MIFTQEDVPVYIGHNADTHEKEYHHEQKPNYVLKHILFMSVLLLFTSVFYCQDVSPYSNGIDEEPVLPGDSD